MFVSYLIKVYHDFKLGKSSFEKFLHMIGETFEGHTIAFGLNYKKWEYMYSLHCKDATYPGLEAQFYTAFDNFQLHPNDTLFQDFDVSKTAIGEMQLDHQWFFPFGMNTNDDSTFVFNLLRNFENLDIVHDKVSYLVVLEPLDTNGIGFYLSSMVRFFLFRMGLGLQFYKHLFSIKTKKDWKSDWYRYYQSKLHHKLFKTKIYIVCESSSKELAKNKIVALQSNFKSFENYPLNEFHLHIVPTPKDMNTLWQSDSSNLLMTSTEIAQFFHFPAAPKNETALLKVTSKKLALPIGIPIVPYTKLPNGEIETTPSTVPDDINIIGVSDYRSIKVPIGMYDEDRLRHIYAIGKTGTGKSKWMISLIRNDILQWRGCMVIDPHGDLVDEAMQRIPEHRKSDVIIFDPMDSDFPFCLNPLDVSPTESKQVLAKWFIDIFKKFFGANRNPMLEHVLRMIFLALLDKPDATLFDIIRALTDKDFRYTMIETIGDDVVRNFWTNEFAWWSQQFNNNAIMPILNKVGQILSIDVLKNIFASTSNKLDFRVAMDTSKIIFIKLSKGKLQEEIMWFLGAMFVTKIYQSAMGRGSLEKTKRIPFFLYVDEFQNFATETFNEILSEARKYGLWLCVAHQFVKQIPTHISDALFGNVGTILSFRVSSEDAVTMAKHFEPFLTWYDLANLNQREWYCKLQVKGQVKDPFSLKSSYMPDPPFDQNLIADLYNLTRTNYARPLIEAKQLLITQQSDVIQAIEIGFDSPMI